MLSFENVNVMNMPLCFGFFTSSSNLICHCRAFFFLHSIHLPQPIGMRHTLESKMGGTCPPFFLFGLYFGFVMKLGYKHISDLFECVLLMFHVVF